jgi:hypothetical protein
MMQIVVHLAKEITILELAFMLNMWPFKRFVSILKNYVLNRAYPK